MFDHDCIAWTSLLTTSVSLIKIISRGKGTCTHILLEDGQVDQCRIRRSCRWVPLAESRIYLGLGSAISK